MLTALWYRKNILVWCLWPLSVLYRLVSAVRRLAYQSGWLHVYRAPVPVIVVGNLTVGGNGKTPVVIWLVEQLRRAGFRPGVVSRGYGGKAERYPLRVDPSTSASVCGDEPKLIANRCGCPVVVAPKRSDAISCLLAEESVNIVISDDGLQHYAMARDIELIVVDGERRFGNEHLLPMGPLREDLWRLQGATAVLCNGGVSQPDEYAMTLEANTLRAVGASDLSPPQPGDKVDAIAGIGHPPRFFATLRQLGFQLQQTVAFADHQTFDIQALRQRFTQYPLLMTEKDAVKCRNDAPKDWWFLPVSARLPDELIQRIIGKLKEQENGARS